MRIGAYQFGVTGNREWNREAIQNAIRRAAFEHVELLVFPECALTGYPPHDLDDPSQLDFEMLKQDYIQIQELSDTYHMHIILGTITKEKRKYYNSAILFSPGNSTATCNDMIYHKRALWGWDKENFCPGKQSGVFEVEGIKVGIRICFEVRFPEYFRELYEAHTDLNVILFYDVSAADDVERYEMIRSHVRTRAVENVCHTLCVDTILPYQTAPTALFDKSGRVLKELERNKEDLLIYDPEWEEN